MEAPSPYAQRFVFIGDYIFGKKSPTSDPLIPEDYQFSAIPFRRTGSYLFDSVCCFIPVHYIPAGPWEGRSDKIESLRVYLKENLISGASDALVEEKMKQILAAQRTISPSCAATKSLLQEMVQNHAEIRWLLDQTWHPYYVAPIHVEAERFLIENWTDTSFEHPVSLRPDMIAGRDETEFRLRLIEQVMRYLYLKVGFGRDLLSDSLLYRDLLRAEEDKARLLALSGKVSAALKCSTFAAETLYEDVLQLLAPQESFDDHPVNLHHDADLLASLHRLRMRLEIAMGETPGFSAEMEPLIGESLEAMMPHVFPVYRRFLAEVAEKVNAA